jgi:hypothetical protein
MAAYRFLTERVLTFPLGEKQHQKEWETIQQTANSNNFPEKLLMKLKQHITRKLTQPTPPTKRNDTKWALFTYTPPHVRKITNILKQTNIKVAFKTNSAIPSLTRPTNKPKTLPHDISGVYSTACNTCKQVYVGQTSRSLKQCYHNI